MLSLIWIKQCITLEQYYATMLDVQTSGSDSLDNVQWTMIKFDTNFLAFHWCEYVIKFWFENNFMVGIKIESVLNALLKRVGGSIYSVRAIVHDVRLVVMPYTHELEI